MVVRKDSPDSVVALNKGDTNVEGFTQVRNVGRRADSSVPRVVFTAGGLGEKAASKRKKLLQVSIVKDPTTMNRFQSLTVGEDSQGGIEEMDGGRGGGDKENENTLNRISDGKSLNQEKERLYGGRVTGERTAVRGGNIEKRNEGVKAGKTWGTKVMSGKPSIPVRGLVFGPTRADHRGFASGKRLRVESGE